MTTLLTKKDVTDTLKISLSTLDRMMADGRIEFVKIGRLVRFPEAALYSFLYFPDGYGE